jgi:hypothetical protein
MLAGAVRMSGVEPVRDRATKVGTTRVGVTNRRWVSARSGRRLLAEGPGGGADRGRGPPVGRTRSK